VRSFVKVFLGSGTFILASATIYWFVSYEPAGTILLLGTAAATYVMAAYGWLRVRGSSEPIEDRGDADPGAGAGEPITSFTMDSPWPLVFGVGASVLAGGLVFGFPLLLLGAILMVVACVGLMRESIA
jgi:cytochrome c oxidase subunit IV